MLSGCYLLASYLESESRVESGSEEEKAVGVVEGCLCSAVLVCFVEKIKRYDGVSTDARQGRKGCFSLLVLVKFVLAAKPGRGGGVPWKVGMFHFTARR